MIYCYIAFLLENVQGGWSEAEVKMMTYWWCNQSCWERQIDIGATNALKWIKWTAAIIIW